MFAIVVAGFFLPRCYFIVSAATSAGSVTGSSLRACAHCALLALCCLPTLPSAGVSPFPFVVMASEGP